MAIHNTSACADPRTEGSATFEQQLCEDIRLRQPHLRSKPFRISEYRPMLYPSLCLPNLRQYAVRVAVDVDP